MWWISHLWVIGLQIAAFIPYIIGSHRFYHNKPNFMLWLIIAVILDVIMTITASSGILPRMHDNQTIPTSSILFIAHIVCAGTGMFGFMGMIIYLWVKGYTGDFPRLKKFQYRWLLPLWIVGVSIALINFIIKVIFGIRIYDIL